MGGESIAGVSASLRIAIVSGVHVRHDAISNAMRDQAEVLRQCGHLVRLFAHHADGPDGDEVTEVANSFALVNHHDYRDADLAIFHFGVHYELFNALLYDPGPRRVVHFHNVTPPSILSGAARSVSEESLLQLSISDRADAVWVVSEHNRDVLVDSTDVHPDRTRQVGLLVRSAGTAARPRVLGAGDAVEVLAVGRFVPAKGQLELLQALGNLPSGSGQLSVTLAGSARFSDDRYMEAIAAAIADLPEHIVADCLTDPSDVELEACYHKADLFVSASFHEGFCVPVVEALAHGCRVVVTDAGASADTVGPCGTVVAVGDVEAIGRAIAEAILDARGAGGCASSGSGACRDHLLAFGPERYTSDLIAAVEDVMLSPRLQPR